MREDGRSVARGALAGALAGLFAAYAMNQFQEAVSRLSPRPGGGGDPSTVKLAQRVIGHELPKERKAQAGNQVHYAFGCFLGLIYGSAAAVAPAVSAGFGMVYGLVVALVMDEAVVPAARLSGPPWATPPSVHAYAIGSHVAFGAALEGARRVLLRAF